MGLYVVSEEAPCETVIQVPATDDMNAVSLCMDVMRCVCSSSLTIGRMLPDDNES